MNIQVSHILAWGTDEQTNKPAVVRSFEIRRFRSLDNAKRFAQTLANTEGRGILVEWIKESLIVMPAKKEAQ